MKRRSTSLKFGKIQIKATVATDGYLSQCLKWKNRQHQMLERMGRTILFTLLMGIQNGTAILENSLTFWYK